MTDENQNRDASAAGNRGGTPDPGRRTEALSEALSGSGMGSDTRAGSLQGGASTGSDDDPDQETIDDTLAREGTASADPQSPSNTDPNPINNTGADKTGPAGDPAEGKPDEADAATG